MSQVSGLFTRRAYNIDSIAVGATDNPKQSVITIILKGTKDDLVQFRTQLLKLPDILEAKEIPYHDSIIRELLLLRVTADSKQREEIFGIVEVFGGKIDEITLDSMLIEVSGDNRRINSILSMLKKFEIKEMARTGQVALELSLKDI